MTQVQCSDSVSVPLDNDWTYIGVLIDRSGSMINLNPSVVSKELTQFIKDQTGGKVTVSAARFDNIYELFIKNELAQNVSITENDIMPRNNTAFFQSFCRLIDDIGKELSEMTDVRPGKILIIVLTDGEENASEGIYAGEAGRKLLFEKINHQQDVYNWVFFFMGTNIDAIKIGSNIGISSTTCINFANNQNNCSKVIQSASAQVKNLRSVSALKFKNRNEMNSCAAFTDKQRIDSSNIN
jgi:hypothetical protein